MNILYPSLYAALAAFAFTSDAGAYTTEGFDLHVAGSSCRSSNDECGEGFFCAGRRCIPTADSCFGTAMNDFVSAFDADSWVDETLASANITKVDLAKAAMLSDNSDDFQASKPFVVLKEAATSNNNPGGIDELQQALDACDTAVDTSDIADRAPSSSGTIVYLGLHIELSAIADIAVSIFWTVGDHAQDTFIRGTFGAEVGVGAEVSALLGFAFTGAPCDIPGGSIIVDKDVGIGPVGGVAVVANLNGLTSLELTLGLGGGAGLGVGYGITRSFDPLSCSPPTLAPTSPPTLAPTSALEPVGWFLGNNGENCNEVCARNNAAGCNSDAMTQVNDDFAVIEIASLLGVSCGGIIFSEESYAVPMLFADPPSCQIVDTLGSLCTESRGDGRRFCCCGQDEDCWI